MTAPKPAPVRAWAVARPNGTLLPETVSPTKVSSIDSFDLAHCSSTFSWRDARRQGYRCVRVVVTVEDQV